MGRTVRCLDFFFSFSFFLVVECFQESLQHRYSCCSACLSRIQKAEGGMGWEGGHWVLTETERERGREIRGGGNRATWKYNPTDWGRSQAKEQARQAG